MREQRFNQRARIADVVGEAEPLALRALEARERELGPDHPDTLKSLLVLATLCEATGRYDEAEPLFVRALAAFERVLGPEHPDTFEAMTFLARLYQETGRHDEAEPLLGRIDAAPRNNGSP